jgi:hypothetical protein
MNRRIPVGTYGGVRGRGLATLPTRLASNPCMGVFVLETGGWQLFVDRPLYGTGVGGCCGTN